jgi:SAM-dependent methyltransferase
MELLGRAVRSYLAGDPSPLGLARDDGYFEELSPAQLIDESAGPHEQELVRLAHGRVLDAGCGAGRIALLLEQAGLPVRGIDISPTLVGVCRSRGLREVEVASVWDDLGGPWDTILLLGNNIGIGADFEGAAALVGHLGAALRPGGSLLMTSLDVTRTTNAEHLRYHERNRRAGRIPGAVRLQLVYRGERSEWYDWLHLSPDEVAVVARRAGLTPEIVAETPWGQFGAALRK